MALPPVSASEISDAMDRFDIQLRATPQWLKWEENQSHRFAIRREGKLYPVKQVIALAAGIPVSSFSGGAESNSYLKERGFEIELLHLPSESETKIALHELLLERVATPIAPQEACQALGERLGLTARLRSELMENSNEVRWESRVRFAWKKLVDAGVLDDSEEGAWKVKIRQQPCIWVEKVKVEGRPDRQQG